MSCDPCLLLRSVSLLFLVLLQPQKAKHRSLAIPALQANPHWSLNGVGRCVFLSGVSGWELSGLLVQLKRPA